MTGERRRPRTEWIVQRGTHPALITEAEADQLLAHLETQRATHRRQDADDYLLTGLLQTPDGQAWAGDSGGYYRIGKGKRIAARRVDDAVLAAVLDDLASEATAQRIAEAMRSALAEPVDGRTVAGLERRLAHLAQQIGRTVDLAAQMDDPSPVLRRVSDLEAERARVAERLQELRRAAAQAEAVEQMSAADVRVLLQHLRADIAEGSRAQGEIRAALAGLIERIALDPVTLACRIDYRLGGVTLASRRGSEVSPVRWAEQVTVLPKRAANTHRRRA